MKRKISILVIVVLMLTSLGVFADKVAQGDLQLEQLIHNKHTHSSGRHEPCERTTKNYSCGCKEDSFECCCGEVMLSTFIRCYTDAKGVLEGGLVKAYPCGSHRHSTTNHEPCVETISKCFCGGTDTSSKCCDTNHQHVGLRHFCVL